MPATQSAPQLTVYRSGLVNLNGEASRLLGGRSHLDVDLLPPSTLRRPWRLDRRPGAGATLRPGGRGGSHFRFRALYRANLLFADLPPRTRKLVFHLLPDPAHADLFTLHPAETPVSSTATRAVVVPSESCVQQNLFQSSDFGRVAA